MHKNSLHPWDVPTGKKAHNLEKHIKLHCIDKISLCTNWNCRLWGACLPASIFLLLHLLAGLADPIALKVKPVKVSDRVYGSCEWARIIVLCYHHFVLKRHYRGIPKPFSMLVALVVADTVFIWQDKVGYQWKNSEKIFALGILSTKCQMPKIEPFRFSGMQ